MKSILVTGGTRGIGEAISKKFAKENKVLAIFNKGIEAANEISKHPNIEVLSIDISCSNSIKENLEKALEILGGKIDYLIHNAGITRDSRLIKMQENQWNEVINTNLNSCFHLSQAFLPYISENGSITFISSVNAEKGQFGQTNYTAAKAGLIGFAKSLSLETASKGIRVNSICPGYIETEMLKTVPEQILSKIKESIPLKRLGKADEVASLVHEVASNKYITGSTFDINGGLYIR